MSPDEPQAANDRITFHRTYLEMRSAPTRASIPAPAGRCALMRSHHPTVSYYRYLYDAVGRDWLWYERLLLSDSELQELITADGVEIYVLYVEGTPAGFVELSFEIAGECEVRYFGMMPEVIGGGYGRYLLNWAIDHAWEKDIERLWLHTCTLDSPKALPFYQRAGFRPYLQETHEVPDPRPIMARHGFAPKQRD